MDLKDIADLPSWEWPGGTAEMIAEALADEKAPKAARLVAVEMAGDMVVMNDQLAAALMGIVSSARETEELRARAAISLGPVLEQTDMSGFDDPYDEPPVTQETFLRVRDLLHKIYADPGVPKEVRRRALEASVRALEDWHADAIRTAYASQDREWKLTAVFAMQYVRGFQKEILEALDNPDEEIHFEAVHAAGNAELKQAWPHVLELLEDPDTEKTLLLAAIEAAALIRPSEARDVLGEFAESEDDEIAETATDAIQMAEGPGEDFEDDEDDAS